MNANVPNDTTAAVQDIKDRNNRFCRLICGAATALPSDLEQICELERRYFPPAMHPWSVNALRECLSNGTRILVLSALHNPTRVDGYLAYYFDDNNRVVIQSVAARHPRQGSGSFLVHSFLATLPPGYNVEVEVDELVSSAREFFLALGFSKHSERAVPPTSKVEVFTLEAEEILPATPQPALSYRRLRGRDIPHLLALQRSGLSTLCETPEQLSQFCTHVDKSGIVVRTHGFLRGYCLYQVTEHCILIHRLAFRLDIADGFDVRKQVTKVIDELKLKLTVTRPQLVLKANACSVPMGWLLEEGFTTGPKKGEYVCKPAAQDLYDPEAAWETALREEAAAAARGESLPWAVRWMMRDDKPAVRRLQAVNYTRYTSEEELSAFLYASRTMSIVDARGSSVLGYLFYQLNQQSIECEELAAGPRGHGVGTRLTEKLLSKCSKNRPTIYFEAPPDSVDFLKRFGVEEICQTTTLDGATFSRMFYQHRPDDGKATTS